MVIYMKLKFLFPLISAIVIGFLLGKFMFNQYDSKSKIKTVFNDKGEKVYFLQQGVYSSKENMEKNTASFDSYIYDLIDDKYYVYVGITKNEQNVEKLQGFFKDMGYIIYVKEFNIDNVSFLESLENFDTMLSNTDSNKTIKSITSQILSKYEELVQNAESSN